MRQVTEQNRFGCPGIAIDSSLPRLGGSDSHLIEFSKCGCPRVHNRVHRCRLGFAGCNYIVVPPRRSNPKLVPVKATVCTSGLLFHDALFANKSGLRREFEIAAPVSRPLIDQGF